MINALLVLLFVFSNYSIWDYVKSTIGIVQLVNFSPFWIYTVPLGGLVNGQIIAVSEVKVALFNTPFWLFFVSTAINLIYIFYLLMSKETKQTPS